MRVDHGEEPVLVTPLVVGGHDAHHLAKREAMRETRIVLTAMPTSVDCAGLLDRSEVLVQPVQRFLD